MSRRQPGILQSLSKLTEMYFVYAFFFEYRDEVFIKVGQSTTPYRRLDAITHGCPFPLSHGVFTQIGGNGPAKSFEIRMKRALADFRTRGEWYCFPAAEGSKFSAAANEVYMSVTGRRLTWSKIDLKAYFEKQSSASEKWLNRRH